MTTIIDGRAVAAHVRADVADRVHNRPKGVRTPGLATVLVGNDPASAVYVASKRRSIRDAGMTDFHRALPVDATQAEVAAVIDEFAVNDAVSGILLQLPLPPGLDSTPLIDRIPPEKDVDGLTTASAGLLAQGRPGLRPCTPSGVIELLDSADVQIAGAQAVVVGRSELVGRPMAQLLLQRDATVTVAHSRTADLATVTRAADIVVASAGVPWLLGREHIKAGATVVDVGIHRTAQGLTGDVRADELAGVAGYLTPVPGGVGPMTIAMLLRNTMLAAERRAGRAAANS